MDTDTDQWSHWIGDDWVWREDAMTELLTGHRDGALFVSGCKTNQGRFYPLFDHVVLLSAPADVLIARVTARTTNPYGSQPEQRAEILANLKAVEPLLRATATHEFDATAPLADVVRRLHGIAST